MFKLFKDLTRAPETLDAPPLTGQPEGPPQPSYAVRSSRAGSFSAAAAAARQPSAPGDSGLQSVAGMSGIVLSRVPSAEPEEEDIEETDSDAILVVALIHALKDASSTLSYIEIFSRLQAVLKSFESRRAFRRRKGFPVLIDLLNDGLAWKARPEGESEDEWQVEEVQRAEGRRLWFEVLAQAMGDREGEAYFARHLGYLSLLPALCKLSPPSDNQSKAEPDSRVLGLLLAHILDSNYTLLSLFSPPDAVEVVLKNDILEQKLGDVFLRWPSALPLLWAYLWRLPEVTESGKGKEAELQASPEDPLFAGELEPQEGSAQSQRLLLTFRILDLTARSSSTNAFLLRKYLTVLPDYLLTRVYGWEPKRHFEVTFPAREEWFQNANAEEERQHHEHIPPCPSLRAVYLSVLSRLLDVGATPQQAWRLIALVRNVPSDADVKKVAATPPPDDTTAGVRRAKAPLKITMPAAPPPVEGLNAEVLNLIQRAMQSQIPSAFVFRGGRANADGGLEIPTLARQWPNWSQGFIFAAWVKISKLNHSVTLLHLSQKDSKHPLFQVRILENSQIGLLSSAHSEAASAEPDEVVCAAPDALIPHHEWVHLSIGCRKGRSLNGGGGEARIFINGRRVGAVRIAYPVPKPAPSSQQTHGHHHTHPYHREPPNEGIRVVMGRQWQDGSKGGADEDAPIGHAEDTEWMLGRSLMLEEVLPEDVLLLMYYLGPRYYGNFQEAMGKFLTYNSATAINLLLHNLAQAASHSTKVALVPANSALVKAIRTGPAIIEANIMFSLCAKDTLPSTESGDYVLNATVPHASRARDFKYGRAKLLGCVFGFTSPDLVEAVSSVGGGVVVLKLIDLASNTDELRTTLTILHDMIKESWSASEEMERIHGFELLSAILRPKMPSLVDVTCARIVIAMLGISPDDAENATVHNSAAYRSIGLEFELWSSAPLDVQKLYFEHIDLLLSASKYKRFNLLRTFQRSGVVRKLLYTIRSGHYEPAALELAIDTLKLTLTSRWSAEEALKPIFSFLVSALCQNTAPSDLIATAEPTPSQLPAALVLKMMAEVLKGHPKRLVKLNRAISVHRLIVIFLQSNPAPFVVIPCMTILEQCLNTPGLESFQRSFESEGGFALLARTLAPLWCSEIQESVCAIIFGPSGTAAASLACAPAIATLLAALETLLQTASDAGGSSGGALSRSISSMKALAITPMPEIEDPTQTAELADGNDTLEQLLNTLAELYTRSSAFRRAISVRRIESMLPSMVDFAAVASSSAKEGAEAQRVAAIRWLTALLNLSKAPTTLTTQMKLVIEQLKADSSTSSSGASLSRSSTGRSSTAAPPSPLARSAVLGGSVSSRPGVMAPPALRRHPSTDAGPSLHRARSFTGEKRIPLRRVLTGESILQEEQDKNAAWRMIIISTDAQKHATMTLERKEHWNRLAQVDWPRLVTTLRAENGVWADKVDKVTWRLDGSEGPMRMRTRLERVDAISGQGPSRGRHKLRDAIPSQDELSSAVSRVNAAPWEDPFALALGEAEPIAEEEAAPKPNPPTPPHQPPAEGEEGSDDGYVDVEDESSNKMRLVAKALQAGDVVEEAHNIVRIVGVDALPGLLILGRRNLYLIDGLVQTPEGQVVEADQAPRDVLTIPSGTLADLDPADQHSHRWAYSEVIESNKRAFLFRDVALELYFADKQNFLIVFRDKRERRAVVSKLSAKSGGRDGVSRSIIGSFVLDTVARAMVDKGAELESMTRRWCNREISNFAYLQMLNQHANRTPNDVTQYPVFPWVLSDYTSQILDLNKPSSFRDLSLPMGALTPARKEAAVERYQATEGVGEPPFHYGTHYSSSMIVCGFMIRLAPFTDIFLALQGGSFDLPDRLFSSIPGAWDSASKANRGDVRELIPEFYYQPSFLINMNHHEFGKKQVTGETVDNVVLPMWALNDPLLFVHWNREALESDYVSRHLPQWIDLTFGCKQRDPASFNCFHPLSYRGAVDLDSMKDEAEKAASTAIIHNFGQTPVQIFKQPHPHRFLGGRTTLPALQRFGVAEHWQLLMRSQLPIAESATTIHHIHDPRFAESKPGLQQKHRLVVPDHPLLTVQYGFADESLRIYFQETGQRLIHIVEGIAVAHAAFVTSNLLITVSPLGVITAWRLVVKGSGFRRSDIALTREATLRGHNREVTCVAVSAAWSLLVTGAEDGAAMVWDMNRLRYTRTLQTPRHEKIQFMTVNEANGHIALASSRYLYLFSLNGHAIAATSVDGGRFPTLRFDNDPLPPPGGNKFTGGIGFLRREFLKWGDLFVVGVNGELVLYRCVPGVRRFEDQDVEPWRLVKQGNLPRSDDIPAGDVTAVAFCGETLYAGFEPAPGSGSHKHPLYQWTLPDGNVRHVPESVASTCMALGCGRGFGLLEPRRHCGGCGGVFCGSHALHVESFNSRYCDRCRGQLAQGMSLGLLYSRAMSRAGSKAGSAQASRRPSIVLDDENALAARSRSASRSLSVPRPSVGNAEQAMDVDPVAGEVAAAAAAATGTPTATAEETA